MGSLVLELQQEVLKPDCDILNALRKAHLIASKLKLYEFDCWVQSELNGYEDAIDTIPAYRIVKGQLKARNPYYGWITVQFQNNQDEAIFCTRKLSDSLPRIIELSHKTQKAFFMKIPVEMEQTIFKLSDMPMQFEIVFSASAHYLGAIVEQVKNCLLEWTIRLEGEGILGEGMQFNQEETAMAKRIPQTINNYYGPVVNGDIKQSQVTVGDHNTFSFNYDNASAFMEKIRESLAKEQLSDEDRTGAMELISEAETKIAEKKSTGIIRASLSSLKDFLIAGGANVTAALIVQYLQSL